MAASAGSVWLKWLLLLAASASSVCRYRALALCVGTVCWLCVLWWHFVLALSVVLCAGSVSVFLLFCDVVNVVVVVCWLVLLSRVNGGNPGPRTK